MFIFLFFFFHHTAPTDIYTLSLHDALPISIFHSGLWEGQCNSPGPPALLASFSNHLRASPRGTSGAPSRTNQSNKANNSPLQFLSEAPPSFLDFESEQSFPPS